MQSRISQVVLAILVVNGVPTYSDACEKHRNQAVKPLSLPSDSLYHLTSTWTDQEDKVIHLNELAGKPRIVAMVYTRCKTACPLLIQDIRVITSRLPKELANKLHIDLFSFDSDSENYKSLQNLTSKYKLDHNWTAYSGPKSSVAELAAALGIQYKRLPSGDYIHSNVVFFINENGEVVAKHEGLGRDVGEFARKIESLLWMRE